jgi:hypothetical protein
LVSNKEEKVFDTSLDSKRPESENQSEDDGEFFENGALVVQTGADWSLFRHMNGSVEVNIEQGGKSFSTLCWTVKDPNWNTRVKMTERSTKNGALVWCRLKPFQAHDQTGTKCIYQATDTV